MERQRQTTNIPVTSILVCGSGIRSSCDQSLTAPHIPPLESRVQQGTPPQTYRMEIPILFCYQPSACAWRLFQDVIDAVNVDFDIPLVSEGRERRAIEKFVDQVPKELAVGRVEHRMDKGTCFFQDLEAHRIENMTGAPNEKVICKAGSGAVYRQMRLQVCRFSLTGATKQ
ncbi:unnamed protein product [Ectocarpus sp. 6 AP-2014]